MRPGTSAISDPQDGELVSSAPDAARLCVGELRRVGVQQIDAGNAAQLRDVACDLRARGMERSRDGVLTAGLFDLVFHRHHYLALFIPPIFEVQADA
ncbi:MAG: hypothetical protein NUV72_08550 [Bauldia sp.]|nr:hypothetical protein [Bauldia sp.]